MEGLFFFKSVRDLEEVDVVGVNPFELEGFDAVSDGVDVKVQWYL